MMLEREAVDALAREILVLIQRLRPLLESTPDSWPGNLVRHSDRSVYRVQWSVRDISRRPGPD